MKTTFKFLLILIILLTISSCKKEKKELLPEKYHFTISNGLENYDSKSKTYNRKYSQYDTLVKIDMNKKDLSQIDKAFRNADFLNFPKEFKCANSSDLIFPSIETIITLYDSNKIEKTVKNTTYCSVKKDQRKSEKFDDLSDILWKIIKNRESIDALKPSDIISL